MQPESGLDETKQIWNAPCVGGPMDGQDGVSRFPKGFLVVDRVAGKCWLYDYDGTSFVVREADGMDLIEDENAENNRYRAAEESEYDVIAAPWIDEPPVNPGDEEDDE